MRIVNMSMCVQVLQHYCSLPVNAESKSDVDTLFAKFKEQLSTAYFDGENALRPVEGAIDAIHALRDAGVLVGLQTGYATSLARQIAAHAKLTECIDGLVTAEDVGFGRHAPYMIFRQIKNWKIFSATHIAKVGDTPRDMEEGRNAGCGLIIGVLSGAGTEDELVQSGAHIVVPDVAYITA